MVQKKCSCVWRIFLASKVFSYVGHGTAAIFSSGQSRFVSKCCQIRNVQQPWTPPTCDWIKANRDVAVKSSKSMIGIGIVIADDQGDVIVATWESLPFCTDSTAAKARVGFSTCILWRDLDLVNVVIEGVAQAVVNAINRSDVNCSMFGHGRDKVSTPRFCSMQSSIRSKKC